MVLIKSISGIRGTIGGKPGDGLSPLDIVKYTASYATHLQRKYNKDRLLLVIGRDARVSGKMVNQIAIGTLIGMGTEVIDLGLSTTPTVELAVTEMGADGGIILTASHNPFEWNALKLLDSNGEFLSAEDGERILEIASGEAYTFSPADKLGDSRQFTNAIQHHISRILELPAVNSDAIRESEFKVAIDAVNSTGGLALDPLLKSLGVDEVIELNTEPSGLFSHDPEPLPVNLESLSNLVKESGAHLGFAVDPDVDRLAIVMENGEMFGEEYTLVAVADYILGLNPGNTVSNLSSTRALRDITEKAGGKYFAAAVGEVNVVQKMKECSAVIGGEGNGGVIYPDLHYGRDALVGIALFLSQLAISGKSCSQLRAAYPNYFMSKNKIEFEPGQDIDRLLDKIAAQYEGNTLNREDGLKIDFDEGWVHLRKSNTEPIVRIYAEGPDEQMARDLAQKFLELAREKQ